ncbi:MAG: hypothetical protein ACHQ6U_04215 [Thermodesulfobacteriota bacterium]
MYILNSTMTDIDKAMLDPTSVFVKPEDVLKAADLSREQKVEVLRRWEYDARELEVAAEENMAGNNSDTLDSVLKALVDLGYESDPENAPPTKQGGD